jgi:hypothetical protein
MNNRNYSSNHGSLVLKVKIKEILTKDFCEALSDKIISQNCKKFRLNLNKLDKNNYLQLINAIISDYKAIKPRGMINYNQVKRELYSEIKRIIH